ncbi:MAG TPA: hypothetical protein VFO54_08030 [Chryseosolibacter sp.]|nr:hypothetical protein [Chryseosolibacter sp.]
MTELFRMINARSMIALRKSLYPIDEYSAGSPGGQKSAGQKSAGLYGYVSRPVLISLLLI